MSKLKTLKSFEVQNLSLSSEELKHVTGGYIRRWYVPGTCKDNCSDHTVMNQEFRWDGGKWIKWGPEYTTGVLLGSNNC